MFFVDSHCHLSYKRFPDFLARADNQADYSVDAMIDRAHNANVEYMVTIGTELSDIDELKEIIKMCFAPSESILKMRTIICRNSQLKKSKK